MSKLKIEENGNKSLSMEHKEEIQIIFHKPMDLLISSILNNIIININKRDSIVSFITNVKIVLGT